MKIWVQSFLIIFMLSGHCHAQADKLTSDWRSKVWQIKYNQTYGKDRLEAEKLHYTETLGISKIEIFKVYQDGNQFVLAFGPFESESAAKKFFIENKASSSIFPDDFKPKLLRFKKKLDNWFEITADGDIDYTSSQTKKSSPPLKPDVVSETAQDNTTPEDNTPQVSKSEIGHVEEQVEVLDLSEIAKLDDGTKREIQKILIHLKMYSGKIDGDFGRGTKDAIKTFQNYLGEEETGSLTEGQLGELKTLAEKPDPKPTKTTESSNISAESSINQSTQEATAESLTMDVVDEKTEELSVDASSKEIIKLAAENASLKNKIETLETQLDYKKRDIETQKRKYIDLLTKDLITSIFEFEGKQPGGSIKNISNFVTITENCLPFDYNASLIENFVIIENHARCIELGDKIKYEIDIHNPLIVDANRIPIKVTMSLLPSFPTTIKKITAKSLSTGIDFLSCTFDLYFKNTVTKEEFTMQLLYDEDNNNFFAEESVDDIIAKSELKPTNNNWEHLTFEIKKSQNTSSNCEPESGKSYSIKKEGQNELITISRYGELSLRNINLTATLDDLVVFVSKNVGLPDNSSGIPVPDANYPFSTDLNLQNTYFKAALEALQQYAALSDIKFKSITVYQANANNYFEKFKAKLPIKKRVIDSEVVFGDEDPNLEKMMPEVGSMLRKLDLEIGTGVLVIGSFGFEERDLCSHTYYDQIIGPRDTAAVTIINFIPLKHFQMKEYPVEISSPPTLVCPENEKIRLVYPTNKLAYAKEEFVKGFFDSISKGLKND
ncbi:peptidoglycan-binding protein [Paracoccaceae bacterium]|nr:peptidoglycan-binding protein [Paracoccaceae bacterium]